MRQNHAGGDKLFADYAGDGVPVVNRLTGEIVHAQVFVAVTGASNYLFAEATWTQGLADWITAHTHAFEYIGGVPNLVVPDNSKVAVIKACLYEPQMHRTYADMASHYRVAILPERAYRGAMGFSVVCVIVVSTALLNLTSPSGSSSNNSTKITKSAVSASLDVSCSRSSITRL